MHHLQAVTFTILVANTFGRPPTYGQPLPMQMLGQVTSSYYSPNLGHSIAMALLKGGHNLHGQTVFFPLLDGSVIEAKVVDTVFFDPKGERING